MKSSVWGKICVVLVGILVTAPAAHAVETLKQFSLTYDKLNLLSMDDLKIPVTNSLTATYTFKGEKVMTPYLGTGLAYTLHPELKPGDMFKVTTGVAGRAGLKFQLDKNSTLDLGYKYFHVSPETLKGDNNSRPQSIEFGLKIKF